MKRKRVLILPTLLVAFGILFISIFRTASVKYDFSDDAGDANLDGIVLGANDLEINYNLAFPGKVLPDSRLWPLKAVRDKAWLAVTTNSNREAELLLLFADKRLAASKILFENGDYETGFATLTKAEKYLEEAMFAEMEMRSSNIDTSEFSRTLAFASLKHMQVVREIEQLAPEDVCPEIIKVKMYSKNAFESSMHSLNEKGLPVPENPFDRD